MKRFQKQRIIMHLIFLPALIFFIIAIPRHVQAAELKLTSDLSCTSDELSVYNKIDLNSYKLSVSGDFTVTGSVIMESGSVLSVEGNLILDQNPFGRARTLTCNNGLIVVSGNVQAHAAYINAKQTIFSVGGNLVAYGGGGMTCSDSYIAVGGTFFTSQCEIFLTDGSVVDITGDLDYSSDRPNDISGTRWIISGNLKQSIFSEPLYFTEVNMITPGTHISILDGNIENLILSGPKSSFSFDNGDCYTNLIAHTTLRFDANGGNTNVENKEVITGEKYGDLPVPTRNGYTFRGWYTAPTDGTRITADSVVTAVENTTIYAHWTAGVPRSVTMLRLYNPNSGEHFYTGSVDEKNTLVSAGWRFEGNAWIAPQDEGNHVYRLYNPNAGDHHYTMSETERDNLVSVGWIYEGVSWNSYDSDSGAPLYRLYNPNAESGAHHYTMSEEEKNNLVSVGWILEGIGWHGI